ncbi:MAG: MFS transporter permease [Proteobacteria bacterium]|nr:MFS transporter permease [Pseudomonadota bacterium]MBU1582833.1 MFS transporter permease [Pseudomonadota bacterium]MBU2451832.1 MFS transporter permease [Pseudomonadota bacterium]MBU2631017.1 MFS transporter permease [Pseudomonadota bacterium]
MVSKKRKLIIISKEEAVFRMDKNGVWHNEHGKFEHPKIIKYFNSSIRKDSTGYYVSQKTDEYEEKVYFPYEDTVLFVSDVIVQEEKDITLALNNNDTIKLDAGKLYNREDNLYLQTPEHRIKFTSRALLKISKFMEEKNGQLFLIIKGNTYPVQSA